MKMLKNNVHFQRIYVNKNAIAKNIRFENYESEINQRQLFKAS